MSSIAAPTIPRTAIPPSLQAEYVHRAAWKAGLLATINVLAHVLAARLIVLVAVVGGICLSYPALNNPDWFRIGFLAVYCAGVVLPAVWLASR